MEWFFCLIAVMVTAIFAAFWAWQYQRRKKALMKRIRNAFGQEPANGKLQKDTDRLWEIWKSDDCFTVDDQTWSCLLYTSRCV